VAENEYPPVDPTTIAPLTGAGVPNLYDYLPSRMVSRGEAAFRKWTTFYDGSVCRYGHRAPRYVKNPRLCVDCHRAKKGKPLIGGKDGGTPEYKSRAYKQREAPSAAPAVVVAPAPIEPDRLEKRFLEAYATYRDVPTSAKHAGLTTAQVEARMSYSAVFKAAVNALEDRLGIKRTQPAAAVFDWTAAKRERFIQVYVDTGDIASARDAINVTPSECFAEIDRNSDFDAMIKAAEPLAVQALEEKAVQLALAGNDKLLQKVLSVKKPEYRERLNLDVNTTEKLSDSQLDTRLAKLFAKFRDRIEAVDAEYIVVEPVRENPAIEYAGSNGSRRAPESNQDLL
jgi:hypothetical protein